MFFSVLLQLCLVAPTGLSGALAGSVVALLLPPPTSAIQRTGQDSVKGSRRKEINNINLFLSGEDKQPNCISLKTPPIRKAWQEDKAMMGCLVPTRHSHSTECSMGSSWASSRSAHSAFLHMTDPLMVGNTQVSYALV